MLGDRVIIFINTMNNNRTHSFFDMLRAQDPKYSDPEVVPPPDVYVRRTFAKLEDGEDEVKY